MSPSVFFGVCMCYLGFISAGYTLGYCLVWVRFIGMLKQWPTVTVVVPGSRHLGCLFSFRLFDHELRLGLFLFSFYLFSTPPRYPVSFHTMVLFIFALAIFAFILFPSPNFSDVCLMFYYVSMAELELVTSLMLWYRGAVMSLLTSHTVCSLEAVWVYFLWTVKSVFSFTCGCFVVFLVSSLTSQRAFVT